MAKGYGDAIALLEFGKQIGMTMAKAEQKPQKTPSPKKEKIPTFEEMWIEEKKRRDQFDAFMKMMQKQNAEEPKKEEKKKSGISERDMVIFLMAFSPIIGAIALGIMRSVLGL